MTDSLSTELADVIFSAAGGSLLLIGGILALGLAGSVLLRLAVGPSRKRARGARSRMLEAAKGASYEAQSIFNRPEKALFAQVEEIVRAELPGHRLMGQVALTEVVRPARGAPRPGTAYWAMHGRSLDMAVIDRRGRVVRAVEYQGAGHWQRDAETRDAIKAEVLSKAGIRLVAVPETWDPAWLRDQIVTLRAVETEAA